MLRGRPEVCLRFSAELATGDLRVSSITIFELVQGAARSPRAAEETARLTRFVQGGPAAIDFTAEDAGAAGRLRADLASRGQMIGAYDLLIAGQALARGWTVVTANTREFERAAGLSLEDWTVGAP